MTKLLRKEKDRSVHGPLIEEIKAMLQEYGEYSANHTRRSCNEIVHKLAKDGCEINCIRLGLVYLRGTL